MERLAPPPPGAHTHEQRHGIGLGLVIGILLGLSIGAVSLLVFSIMREDTVSEITKPAAPAIQNIAPTVQAPRPEVLPRNTNTINNIPTKPVSPAPEVVSTSPLEGATNAPADIEIAITFSAAMDPETLDEKTISVVNETANEDLTSDMQFVYRADTRQVTISFSDPTKSFGDKQVIRVVVSTDATDLAGSPLEDTFELTFTTRP